MFIVVVDAIVVVIFLVSVALDHQMQRNSNNKTAWQESTGHRVFSFTPGVQYRCMLVLVVPGMSSSTSTF